MPSPSPFSILRGRRSTRTTISLGALAVAATVALSAGAQTSTIAVPAR